MMLFILRDAQGNALYEGRSWPMARAALDHILMNDDGCPELEVLPEPDSKM